MIKYDLKNRMQAQKGIKFLLSVCAALVLIFPSATQAQVVHLEGEDNEESHGEGLRVTLDYSQHIPGGQGLGLTLGFDTYELEVAEGVKIVPAVDLGVAYNIDIDDPDVKHLLQVGVATKLRISMDLTQPGWVTKIHAIPWFGFGANGCWSIHETRNSSQFLRVNDGWQLCYGPVLGMDLALGENMLLSLGLETMFYSLGSSGLPNTPFMMAGSKLGIGYKFLF